MQHSDRAHSQWGASSSHRWMACPASIKLEEQAPPAKESPYAAEGTCAHELAEAALMQNKMCSDFIGETFEGWEVTEEMAEYVQTYVDYVLEVSRGPNKDVVIEEKFDLSFIREGMFGSNDACVLEQFGTLEVIDLKYGKGVEVSPENNKQLMYYALGAANGGDFENVKLTIVQPRVQDPIKSWTTSMARLNEFASELGIAVDATKDPNAKAVSGSHCRFCKAKAICTAKLDQAREIAKVDFGAKSPVSRGSLPAPALMDEQTLEKVLDHTRDIQDWLKAVNEYAKQRLENGHSIEGYKLVEGRSSRKVESEKELYLAYGDEIYNKKLKTLADLKKIAGKDLDQFLFKPVGKPTMVSACDKRPAITSSNKSGAEDFGTKTPNKGNNFNNFEF